MRRAWLFRRVLAPLGAPALALLAVLALAGTIASEPEPPAVAPATGPQPPRLLLLRYGTSDFPAAFALDRTAPNERIPFAWLFYLLQAGERLVLIDSGFSDAGRRKDFGLREFRPPLEMLPAAGVRPEQVTDLVLTHGHFDHAGLIAELPRARIYLRRPAAETLVGRQGPREAAAALRRARLAGRLVEFPARRDDRRTILKAQDLAVELLFTGGHTAGSQAVSIVREGPHAAKGASRYLITGDECYIIEECRAGRGLPARAAFSVAANRRFILYLKQEAARGTRLLNLHDPELPGQFERLQPGIYRVF